MTVFIVQVFVMWNCKHSVSDSILLIDCLNDSVSSYISECHGNSVCVCICDSLGNSLSSHCINSLCDSLVISPSQAWS